MGAGAPLGSATSVLLCLVCRCVSPGSGPRAPEQDWGPEGLPLGEPGVHVLRQHMDVLSSPRAVLSPAFVTASSGVAADS